MKLKFSGKNKTDVLGFGLGKNFGGSLFWPLLVALLFLLQCKPSGLKKDSYVLQRYTSSDVITLNPLLITDGFSRVVSNLIYESLLVRDNETLQWKANLAKDWKVSQDKKFYTFYLRDDVFFQDGYPLTAYDVAFTFEKMMDKNVPNPQQKVYYQDIKKATVIDEHCIVFESEKPTFLTLGNLADLAVLPKHIFSKVDDFVVNEYNMERPVGSGPYVLETNKAGYYVYLKRNENYWGEKPQIRRIEYKVLKNDFSALQLLKKQQLDLMNLKPFQWIRQTDSPAFTRNFKKIKYLSRFFSYIAYNTRYFPFQDRRVRLAMAHALDLPKIKRTLLQDLAEITTGNFWLNSPQYNKSLPVIPYNPTKALELLHEAGFQDSDGDGWLDKDGKKFSFELIIPSGVEFFERFAGVMKESLQELGVEIEIISLEFSALLNRMEERDFEAFMLGWSTPIESNPYQLWHSSQIAKGDNFTAFTTPEMDRLIEEALLEFDPQKRNAMYQRFHEILYQNQPYTFLFTSYVLAAVHRRFENTRVYKAGMDISEWAINENFLTQPPQPPTQP